MSNYSNTFGGAAKDAAESIILGTDFDTEFDNIATMSASKTDKVVPAATDNVATLSASGNLQDGGFKPTTYVKTILDDADAGAVKDTLLLSTAVTITPSSDADVTLSATEATYGRLKLANGSWTTGRNIIVPTNQRLYLVDNSAGSYTATVKTAAGTGIAVVSGNSRVLLCDGTNVIDPLPTAGETRTGIVELATSAEVQTGTDANRVPSVSSLRSGLLVRGTAIATTSGTSHDFTGIPSWVKRITVCLDAVSTNGTSLVQVQIGAGSVTTSGYNSKGSYSTTVVNTSSSATGFVVEGNAATNSRIIVMTLINITGNTWLASHSGCYNDITATLYGGGDVTLSGTLDRVRLTTVGGVDTFDAGSFNIIYE